MPSKLKDHEGIDIAFYLCLFSLNAEACILNKGALLNLRNVTLMNAIMRSEISDYVFLITDDAQLS